MTNHDQVAQLKRAVQAIQDLRAKLAAVERARTEPIAIIGIGCRFPGGVTSPEAFWQLLVNGVDAITPVPPDRWDSEDLFDADPAAPGKITTRWGGFLDDIDQFDAAFFGISPREAARMDPQQRLLLEVAWEALEDAGQTTARLAGSQTGVFIGLHSHSQDYYSLQVADPAAIDLYTGTGTAHNVASGRLAYVFDLHGPNVAVDTACSSSLVAVHLAVQSLRAGECNQALAGGVNVMLSPEFTIAASRMRMLAGDGRCKTFDARADGFVRGEGCGIVVLKRLSDALAAGDPIYAVIRGSAINQDGHTNGLTAPNGLSQQAVIRAALENGGVDPARVTYVEAHGTGTPLGDPIEVEALAAVLGAASDRRCYLGSVKTNFGHLEGAAGIAGLIKTALALQQQAIPANLHFTALNPHIQLGGTRLEVPTALLPWPLDEQRYAGVSSFGWSGTNAHVILEAAPPAAPLASPRPPARTHYLLPVSARDPKALRALARSLQELFTSDQSAAPDAVCYTASVHRSHHDYRLAVVGQSRAELAQQLAAALASEGSIGQKPVTRLPGLVFVCPGQGSQWLGMGRQLFAQVPAFRDVIERCDQAMKPLVAWSLIEQLTALETRLSDIDVIQPALCAIEIALAAAWRAWGVEPDAVVGHSMGEVAAACIAGALTLDEAMLIICTRSRLMKRVSGQGAMAVVNLPVDQAQAAIGSYADRLSVAVSNSPQSSVLSGDPGTLDTVIKALQSRNVFCRPVQVDVAAHSPHMDALRAELETALRNLKPQAARQPIYSTVTGRLINGEELAAAYWSRNLREPVMFSAAVQQMIADGITTFIELSPHPILLAAIEQGLQHRQLTGLALPSLRREEDEQTVLLASLGALYAHGYDIAWSQLYPQGQLVSLPPYPWQHERFWFEAPAAVSKATWLAELDHPLLGARLPELAQLPDGSCVWHHRLDARWNRFLREHYALGASDTLPEQVYRDMALAAAQLLFGQRLHTLGELTVLQPVPLDSTDVTLQATLTPVDDRTARFELFSRVAPGTWQKCIIAIVAISSADLEWLYAVTWQVKPRAAAAATHALPAGRWLIFSEADAFGSDLAAALSAQGDHCLFVTPGLTYAREPDRISVDPARREDFQRLCAEVFRFDQPPIRGILYLWGLTAQAQAVTCGGALHLVQSLAHVKQLPLPRVWFITRGAQQVADEAGLAVAQATLWGLGRVIAVEHPDLWGGLIDLDPAAANAAAVVATEVTTPEHEDQIALRSNRRYVARLQQAPQAPDTGLLVRADATYLITGGLGGLGLQVARWLAQQGARHLVLIGRSAPRPEALEIIRNLKQAGVQATVNSCDVSEAAAVMRLIAEIDQTPAPLRGIIHAAGVLDDGVLLLQDWSRFARVFASKVEGAWNLHTAVRDRRLDFFVLFSSAAALLGNPGQANYAAANAFLDTLAQYRRASGLPAVSINWGFWAEVGLAIQAGRSARLSGRGLAAFSPEQGLEALDYVLRREYTTLAVLDIDWLTYFKQLPSGQPPAFMRELQAGTAAAAVNEQSVERSDIMQRLSELAEADRVEVFSAYVRQLAALVMRFDTIEAIAPDQGFFRLGMDSMMAVELRNRLQIDLDCPLPPMLTFDYPTVKALTRYLLEVLFPAAPAATETDVPSEALAELADLSKDELKALLDEELRSIDEGALE